MLPQTFKKYFWDVDFEAIDLKRDRRFVMARLLNYGRLDAWRWLRQAYGNEQISDTIKTEKRLGLREPVRHLAQLISD